MVDGLEIINEFDERYQEAFRSWNSFFPEADTDLRFFLGDQWNDQEKKALQEQGRNAFVFNRVRRVINQVTGYQRQHRLSSVVTPFEDADQKAAEQMTQLLMHSMNFGDGYHTISDCFGGALKTGWNLASIWMDYRSDPVNGDIKFTREPWNGFICDPYFTKLDLSDCSYIIRRRYLSPDQVKSLLPDHHEELDELQHVGWERDDKFTWLPYQRNPGGPQMMAYNEFYTQGWKSQKVLVDMDTGEYQDWDASPEDFNRLKEMVPSYELITREKRFIQMHVIVNDRYITSEINPYGLDEYPFVPFVSIFEPESDDWMLKVQSLVRCMRDPQREANRRRSQMIDIMDSQINSGWIATEGSVVNPRSLFESSQGKVIWKNKGAEPGALEKIQPANLPPGDLELQRLFDQDINEIAGANDAAFGIMDNGNNSGIAQMLRQGASLTNLQDVYDNLRLSQKYLSRKAVRLMQTWRPEKIKRIINEDPVPQIYDPSFVKYDCVVQEGLLTETQRQMHFRQLLDLAQIGAIPPEMLASEAPIQARTDFMQKLEQQQQAQSEQVQRQQAAQDQLLEAQTNLATSRSLEQVAGARERFTRSVANLGLEDERSSEAVQNRTQAVLDQAKAIKELEEIDLRNSKDAMALSAMLREKNKLEEEQAKADNVLISERAAALQPPNLEAPNAQV